MRALLARLVVVVGLVTGLGLAVAGPTSAAGTPLGYGTGSGFCATAVPGGYDLGSSFDNVYACGPGNNSGTGYKVPASGPYAGFFEDATWSYQCVELANRFLFDQFGITPVKGSSLVGGNYVAAVHASNPSIGVASSPGTTLPVAGDIISMWNTSNTAHSQNGADSHVAVVTGVTPTGSGWTLSIIEQNASAKGASAITVSANGTVWSYGNGEYTSFQWLNLRGGSSSTGGSGASVRSIATSDGHVQLFSTVGGVVKQNWYSPSNGTIGGWTQSAGLAAQAVGRPALVARSGQSVIDVFVRGGDGHVYETWYNYGNGAWGGWIGLGGSVSSDPQAVATTDGHDQVFATGNNLVQQNWFSPGNGAIGGWSTSAGLGAGATGSPALVARPGQSVIDEFVRGGDGHVYETWYNYGNGAWGGWIGLGGSVSSDPQAVATTDGHDQVFATGNNLVQQNWFSPGNGAIGGWSTSAGLGAGATGSPALVARPGQSVIDEFVRGGDGHVYETWYNYGNGAWGGWIGLGGSVSSDPQAVATTDGHDQVFATGNNLVQQNWFSPGNGAIGGWIAF